MTSPPGNAGAAAAESNANGSSRVPFGTFTGVFTPTLLTIFGVIMYVRVGWAVGNGGLMGAWLVMLLAMGITTLTGLSLSSIATNTRIGAGGPYAVIARSLGFEVGGSIGVPLSLTRPLGVAMYIIGFPGTPNVDDFIECVRMARGTCIFVRDSGRENALV